MFDLTARTTVRYGDGEHLFDPLSGSGEKEDTMPARSHPNLKLLVLRMLVLGASVVVVVFLLLARTGAADAPPPPTQTHIVAPGDTLWKIAGAITPDGGDVRPLIAAIIEVNGLDDATILPGQQLQVPVG